MESKLRKIIKEFMPPIVLRLIKRNASLGLTGCYASWDEAVQASTGYDSKIILERTKESLLKVRNGEAVYERDSVLFNEIQYAWPLLACLMWVAAKSGGKLNVLDFGGSLGSTYFQNLAFLASIPELRWNIVEQPSHVEIGKEFFENDRLKFFSSIKDCVAVSQPNVVILSSVLQYLEKPYDVLGELMELNCEHIIIDRTPFWDGSNDRLSVQQVPSYIYKASYPSWIFSRSRFMSPILKKGFNVAIEFENEDHLAGPINFNYKGMIIARKKIGKYEQDIRSGTI